MPARRLSFFPILSVLVVSLACGGNSGNGGSPPPPPPPVTYTISGTLSGLASSIVLSNNGGNNLPLFANGSFSFTKPVTSGATYDVTIWAEPSSPVQFCTVSNGKGTASANVSNVQVTCTTPSEQVLASFGQQADDQEPIGGLIFDDLGNLYGVTSGGHSGYGTVYRLTSSNGQWTHTVLYTFCQLVSCADGRGPLAGLIRDAAGNLYGTTSLGGAYGGGTAFELSPVGNGTWTETVLHSFGNGTDGIVPRSPLIFDAAGNLYGTTTGGGASGCVGTCGGTVFELSPPNSSGDWTEKLLYSFCSASGSYCPDGNAPMAGVVFDGAGNLYGTTYSGGGNPAQFGVVYELTPTNGGQWTETVLYKFQDGSLDGSNPRSELILDSAGNLYGTTNYGYVTASSGNLGVVFELVHHSGQWQERVIYAFSGPDGMSPFTPLVIDKAGNLYGTTGFGGALGSGGGFGVVYALTPGFSDSLWLGVPLHTFLDQGDGAYPASGLVMDASGNLYGVGNLGEPNQAAVVFEVTP